MISFYHFERDRLVQTDVVGSFLSLPERTIWVDLLNPTKEEEAAVECALGIGVPTQDEMQEIETSSRLYTEDGATVMTLLVLSKISNTSVDSSPVTFILFGDYLITVRYGDPVPVTQYIARAKKQPSLVATSVQAFVGLLEQIADYLADLLEGATDELELLSQKIFVTDVAIRTSVLPSYREAIHRIGHVGDLSSKAKGSLLNLTRLLLFFAAQPNVSPQIKERMKTVMQDASSIDEQARFLSAKVGFLMDATMGLINLEQNNIIKMFSVAAVIFLPPTLIASLYGMNFEHMPELSWRYGYVFALIMMVISAAIPLWVFWRKRWL